MVVLVYQRANGGYSMIVLVIGTAGTAASSYVNSIENPPICAGESSICWRLIQKNPLNIKLTYHC
jgi:hypothetical protein